MRRFRTKHRLNKNNQDVNKKIRKSRRASSYIGEIGIGTSQEIEDGLYLENIEYSFQPGAEMLRSTCMQRPSLMHYLRKRARNKKKR